MTKRVWSAWAWVATIAIVLAAVAFLAPAGTAARGTDNAPGGAPCASALDSFFTPHLSTVVPGSRPITAAQYKYCGLMVPLYSWIGGVAGATGIVLAGVAIGVGARRRRKPAVLSDGLLPGDF
jgi:hypothetical protein